MFFKTFKKQINDLKNEVESLKQDQKHLCGNIEDLEKENQMIKRILRNHSHGEIVGYFVREMYFYGEPLYCLYLYKDGKECIFEHLFGMPNPVFTQGEAENIVYVESGDKSRKYILDLKNGTSILVSKESNEET